jgi:hypothetical protein
LHAESRVPCSGWRMSAVDWARSAGFHDTAALLERLGGVPARQPATVEDMVQMQPGQNKGAETLPRPGSFCLFLLSSFSCLLVLVGAPVSPIAHAQSELMLLTSNQVWKAA